MTYIVHAFSRDDAWGSSAARKQISHDSQAEKTDSRPPAARCQARSPTPESPLTTVPGAPLCSPTRINGAAQLC